MNLVTDSESNQALSATQEFATKVLDKIDGLFIPFGVEAIQAMSPRDVGRFVGSIIAGQSTNNVHGTSYSELSKQHLLRIIGKDVFHKLNPNWEEAKLTGTVHVDKVDVYSKEFAETTNDFFIGLFGSESQPKPLQTMNEFIEASEYIVEVVVDALRNEDSLEAVYHVSKYLTNLCNIEPTRTHTRGRRLDLDDMVEHRSERGSRSRVRRGSSYSRR